MRKLFYAGDHILVSDRTCKAVLSYSRALANAGKSDVVSVPMLAEGGAVVLAHLIIGPPSQIYSIPVEHVSMEPDNLETIERLEVMSRELEPGRPSWPQEMEDIPDLDGLGLYSDY